MTFDLVALKGDNLLFERLYCGNVSILMKISGSFVMIFLKFGKDFGFFGLKKA